MVDYYLRSIDPKLWAGFKKRAVSEGHTLRWVLLALIRRYVEKGLN